MDNPTIQEQAVTLHEYYLNLIEAGFDEHQALHIVSGKPCCDKTIEGSE
jgi:hypothetical protein